VCAVRIVDEDTVADTTGGLRERLIRAGRTLRAALFADGPVFPERVQHHLVAFEIQRNDSVEEVLAIRSHGSVYQVSRYVSQGKRTISLRTERGKRVVKSDRVVGLTILESWEGTPPKRTFEAYPDVFERHGWTERSAYPGTDSE